MSFLHSSIPSVEEVDKDLKEIESKYESNAAASQPKKPWTKTLSVLSKEFDTLGLPRLNLDSDRDELLEQLVNNAGLLVELYEENDKSVKDAELNAKEFVAKTQNMMRKELVEALKAANVVEKQNKSLEMKIQMKTDEIKAAACKEKCLTKQLKQIKSEHSTAESEIETKISKTKNKIECLSLNSDKYKSDPIFKLVNKFRKRETIYEEEIKRLENNGKELQQQIWDVKEEISSVLFPNKK